MAVPGDAPAGDRGLIEDAVKLLLSGAPAGWARLYGEFEPSAQPPVAAVSVTTANGRSQPLAVSAGVLSVLAEQQRSSAAAGVPWRRLAIDCHADGRLSARTENDPGSAAAVPSLTPPDPQRWPRRLLVALTAGCLIGAAAVFAVGWQWSPPPRLAMIPLPPPPPRQQEAFDVISRWFDAENHSDAAGMRALTCANPGKQLVDRTNTTQWYGEDQEIIYPQVVETFSEDGTEFKVTVAIRFHPLDDRMRREAELAQASGGFVTDNFILVDEGGQLKVCDLRNEGNG